MLRVPHLIILVLVLGCAACSRSDPRRTSGPVSQARPEARETAADRWPIASLTEIDGQLLVEIPAGSAQGIDTSTFFRVYDHEQPGVIKCMLKTTEVFGPERSAAVMIGGLFDLNNPLALGDEVLIVRDLAFYGSGAAVEEAVALEEQELANEAAAEQAAFDKLRANYQRRLRELIAEHEERVISQQAAHERILQDLTRSQAEALERKDLERRSDLAALRTALLADARKEVGETEQEQRQRILALQRERDVLQTEVDKILREQERLKQRIADQTRAAADQQRRHEAAMRAEAESRAILEARLAQIEHNLDAGQDQSEAILSSDPNQAETILERLERLTGERNQAQNRATLLKGQLEQMQAQFDLLSKRHQAAQERLEALADEEAREKHLRQTNEDLQGAVTRLQEHLDAASLARLETERRLFDLITRILRLSSAQPQQLEFLKQRLREDLADNDPEATDARP